MSESPMSTFDLIHRPALGAAKPIHSERIHLAPVAEGAILLVIATSGSVEILAAAAAESGFALRANGPGQWYLVGETSLPRDAIAALRQRLGDGFAVVDQSHGRVRIAIEGSAVEDVLAKGTGIDLAAFAIGAATNTLVGHVAVHLTRLSGIRFELMPLRGFAETVWHDLETMAGEFTDH